MAMKCRMCEAVISQQEADEAFEIIGPGYPTLCTGCAHDLAEQEEEREQAMIIPLTNTPTVNDLPHPVVELPSKFVMYEPDEAGVCTHEDDPRHVISCGICNKHCVVSREEYNADITPVCSECEQKAAELADAYDVVQ